MHPRVLPCSGDVVTVRRDREKKTKGTKRVQQLLMRLYSYIYVRESEGGRGREREREEKSTSTKAQPSS